MQGRHKSQTFLIVVDDLFAQGGTQTFAFQLGKILVEQGGSIRYLSLKKQSERGNSSVATLGIKRNYEILFKRKKIRSLIDEHDRTIILSGQIFQYFTFISHSKKIIYRESNNPVYRNSVRAFPTACILQIMYKFFLVTKPNLIVQNAEVYSDLVGRSKERNNIRLLPNPCFLNLESAVDADEKRSFDLIYMSRHTLEKGSDRAEYVFQNTELSGTVLGHNEYFARSKNRSNVKYLGRVDDLAGHYKSAKFLLLLSRVEGFPNCVHEAIQCGTRVLASEELSWLTELSPELASAISLVNCRDHAAMSRQVSTLVRSYEGPVPVADRQRIRRQFDPHMYVEKLINDEFASK